MKLISTARAARLLGMDADTLRRRETPDGRWAQVYGHRIRVFRIDLSPHAQRRYVEEDILRVLALMEKEAAGR